MKNCLNDFSEWKWLNESRMMEVLRKRGTAQQHLEAVEQAVQRFIGNNKASDDRTMLFIHYMNC